MVVPGFRVPGWGWVRFGDGARAWGWTLALAGGGAVGGGGAVAPVRGMGVGAEGRRPLLGGSWARRGRGRVTGREPRQGGWRAAAIRKDVRRHARVRLLLPLLHTPGSALGPVPWPRSCSAGPVRRHHGCEAAVPPWQGWPTKFSRFSNFSRG